MAVYHPGLILFRRVEGFFRDDEVAGRTDVPVGVGVSQGSESGPQAPWIEGYELSAYPGEVHADGVRAIIRTAMDSPQPVTLVCIGPMPNIREALRREPGIAARMKFVGMHGSIRRRHGGVEGAIAEYNVARDVPACRDVFAAPWIDGTITPLDTCGQVRLAGDLYANLKQCDEPLLQAVLANYRLWSAVHPEHDADRASSILFDTVAVHLAHST